MAKVAQGLGLSPDDRPGHQPLRRWTRALVKTHPDWFVRDGGRRRQPLLRRGRRQQGRLARPGPVRPLTGSRRRANGLLRLLRRCGRASDRPGLLAASAATPPIRSRGHFWRRLIGRIRAAHPEVTFVAETLGCSPEQTRDTAAAGFDCHLQQRQVVGLPQQLAAGAVRADPQHRPLHRLPGEPRHPAPVRRVRRQPRGPEAALPVHRPVLRRGHDPHGLRIRLPQAPGRGAHHARRLGGDGRRPHRLHPPGQRHQGRLPRSSRRTASSSAWTTPTPPSWSSGRAPTGAGTRPC